MRLLYLSCHAILEYDELKLFEEMGVNYFSLGSYLDPQNPVDPIRPALGRSVDPDLLKIAPLKDNLTPEFLEHFDTIVVMHVPEWIEKNWDKFKGKRVIWRTIGQSTQAVERRMSFYRQQGLEVVRYAQREQNIRDNVGCDALIHFYKDPDEFKGYNGFNREVITIAQDMQNRAEYCNYDAFKYLIDGFSAKLYGTKNEGSGELSGGFLTYDEMKQKLKDSRVYIYTGTQPASYTLNFMEALMTGIPMVCIGKKYANSLEIAGDTYEVEDIIQNGYNGYISDDLDYLRKCIHTLLEDSNLAKKIGEQGRKTAIDLFGKDIIMRKWREFLRI